MMMIGIKKLRSPPDSRTSVLLHISETVGDAAAARGPSESRGAAAPRACGSFNI